MWEQGIHFGGVKSEERAVAKYYWAGINQSLLSVIDASGVLVMYNSRTVELGPVSCACYACFSYGCIIAKFVMRLKYCNVKKYNRWHLSLSLLYS